MRPDVKRFTRRFVMTAPFGFHMRPASLFAKTAQQHESTVMIGKTNGIFVNGKSLIGLLTLEILCGEEVVVSVSGDDAAETILNVERLFANAFGQRHPEVALTESTAGSSSLPPGLREEREKPQSCA